MAWGGGGGGVKEPIPSKGFLSHVHDVRLWVPTVFISSEYVKRYYDDTAGSSWKNSSFISVQQRHIN